MDNFDVEPGGSSQGWPALSLIRMLWKRKFHILVVWAVLSAAVVAVVMVWPATYRAESLILVDSQKIPEKFVSATVNVELQDRLATISQRILSSTRLQKIIDSLNLYEKERKTHAQEEIVEIMRGDIKITPEKGWIQNRPGAFRVSYEGHNPTMVAEVTNQLGNLFIDENLRARETIAEGTSSFMKSQLDEAKKNLEAQEAKLSQFKQSYNGELPQQESSLSSELGRLQIQLQGNQDALNRANQNKITLESSLSVALSTEVTLQRMVARAAPDANGTRYVAADGTSSAAPVKKRSERLEDELAVMNTRYAPNHPDIRTLKANIEQAKAQEAQEEAKALQHKDAAPKKVDQDSKQAKATTEAPDPLAGSTPEAVAALAGQRERIALLRAQIAAVNVELKTRQADQLKILSQSEQVQGRLRHLPLREQEMAQVTRDYEMSKANYRSLQDKIFAADMATEMEHNQKSERFMILDSARPPEKPISPDRPLFAGLGSFGALVLSLAFWLASEVRKNKIMGEWELPEGAVVLGRVPNLIHPQSTPSRGIWKRGAMASASATALVLISAAAYFVWIRR